MESGQKPKDIKVEFTCEVKDLPPTKREQRRDKRAKKVSSFCGRVSLVFLVLGLYFIFTTTNWGGRPYYARSNNNGFIILVLCCVIYGKLV